MSSEVTAETSAIDDVVGGEGAGAIEKLEFGNPHFLHSLFANDESLLRVTEQAVGARITTRDGWVKIDGGADAKAKTRALFDRLEGLRRRGVEISAPLFRMALEAIDDKELSKSIGDLAEIRLLGSATRSQVTPTRTQRRPRRRSSS